MQSNNVTWRGCCCCCVCWCWTPAHFGGNFCGCTNTLFACKVQMNIKGQHVCLAHWRVMGCTYSHPPSHTYHHHHHQNHYQTPHSLHPHNNTQNTHWPSSSCWLEVTQPCVLSITQCMKRLLYVTRASQKNLPPSSQCSQLAQLAPSLFPSPALHTSTQHPPSLHTCQLAQLDPTTCSTLVGLGHRSKAAEPQ